MDKYFIKTFGCQYNEWDAARLDFLLQKLNLVPTHEKDADVIFILSCSVRKSAVDRAMGVANNNLGKKTVVTGCVLDDDKKKYERKNIFNHLLFSSFNKRRYMETGCKFTFELFDK